MFKRIDGSEPPIFSVRLLLDNLDKEAIDKAIAFRKTFGALPDGDGNVIGIVLAEICRGWLENHDQWDCESPNDFDEPF